MIRARALYLTLFAFMAMIGGGPVQAASLDQLRASGAVGERYDGYVVARKNVPGAAAIVAEVNAKRRRIYEKRAAQQKISAAQVGAVYAAQIFQKAPSGTWFQSKDGSWRRK
jgi:uncharacterized protein YdbL (DUF1318 family)